MYRKQLITKQANTFTLTQKDIGKHSNHIGFATVVIWEVARSARSLLGMYNARKCQCENAFWVSCVLREKTKLPNAHQSMHVFDAEDKTQQEGAGRIRSAGQAVLCRCL